MRLSRTKRRKSYGAEFSPRDTFVFLTCQQSNIDFDMFAIKASKKMLNKNMIADLSLRLHERYGKKSRNHSLAQAVLHISSSLPM